MESNVKNNPSENTTSILAKVGNKVSEVGEILGRGVKALRNGIIYPVWPKNWFKSLDEMWHDIKNGGRYVIGNSLEEYNSPIETTEASKYLGVEVKEQEKGKRRVIFLASRTLTGDPYLSPGQLDEIETLNRESKYSNITIFREENKIVVEVNVKDIIEKIKEKNPEMDEKTIKKYALEGIAKEVDDNLKKLAGITGGEFKVHTDLKLLYGIAEKLYQEYDNQEKPSVTKPKESMSDEKLSQVIKELGDGFLNLENVSGETIKPLSTPTVEKEERGKGHF